MDFVALDFETANFKRQSVCSIGIAVVKNMEIVKTVDKLIKPTPDYYEHINMSIHKITPEMTKDEPTFAEMWNELRPFFDNTKVIAHNASFDLSALRYVLNSFHIPYPELDYYCSMLISKSVFPGLINYQLPTVCKHIGLSNLTHHNAKSDAVACANIMIDICKKNDVSSLEELEQKLTFSRGKLFSDSYRPFRCHINKRVSNNQLFDKAPDPSHFDVEHPFFNKRVAFTGALSKFSRNDAKQIVANIGGITNPDTLSSKTNFLIVGTYDFYKYGEGFKSSKLKNAEKFIANGMDLEIISETDFFKMVHSEVNSFEISLEQITTDSQEFINRNKYNDFSGKTVYFSSDLSIKRTTAFQYVGNCSGYGHDYDIDEISNAHFFVVSNKLIADLENGIKGKSIIDFEKIRNEAQNRGNVNSIRIISEQTFLEYLELRKKAQRGDIKMNIYESEVDNQHTNNYPNNQ